MSKIAKIYKQFCKNVLEEQILSAKALLAKIAIQALFRRSKDVTSEHKWLASEQKQQTVSKTKSGGDYFTFKAQRSKPMVFIHESVKNCKQIREGPTILSSHEMLGFPIKPNGYKIKGVTDYAGDFQRGTDKPRPEFIGTMLDEVMKPTNIIKAFPGHWQNHANINFEGYAGLYELCKGVSVCEMHNAYLFSNVFTPDILIDLKYDELCDKNPELLNEFKELLSTNRILLSRSVDLTKLSAKDAYIALGYSDALRRANEIKRDVRKCQFSDVLEESVQMHQYFRLVNRANGHIIFLEKNGEIKCPIDRFKIFSTIPGVPCCQLYKLLNLKIGDNFYPQRYIIH